MTLEKFIHQPKSKQYCPSPSERACPDFSGGCPKVTQDSLRDSLWRGKALIQRIFYFIFLLMVHTSAADAQQKKVCAFKWQIAAALPASEGQLKSLGFAGAINGINNNVLIVAGGANFPNGMPWKGGKKYYSNEIYILQKVGNKFIWNNNIKDSLPEPVAYCGVTSTDDGVVYIGGENENGISDKCYLLKWNSIKNSMDVKPLPKLPLGLTNVAAANIGNVVYAAGGDEAHKSSNSFFSLDLNHANPQWIRLPRLPIALANATAVAQKNATGKSIYLIGGRSKTASGTSDLHNTTYAFDLSKNEWRKCAGLSDGKNTTNLSAAAGVALHENEILIIGGDNGKIFHQIESYISQIAKATTAEERDKLTQEKNDLIIHHKGFDRSLLLYNTISNTWKKIGEYPYPAQVTTTGVKWGNDIVISNGEIKPGVRTPNVVVGCK